MSEGLAAPGPGDPGATALLYLCMEVAGCPTVCRHCWAQGSGYGAMPLADIEWVLEQAHRFCDDQGVGFDAYPMHEVAAHPDAARLFGLFNSHSGTVRGCADGRAGTMFEPLTTTGVPLVVRDDWREVLRAAADTGTLNLWTAFHGAGDVHDRQAGHRGAFAETCRGIQRALAAGVSVGCNVFLTTVSLPQPDELTAMLPLLGVHATSIETASFLPTPRSRRNERLRPALPDLLPAAARITRLTALPDRWADLEARTEAAWVSRAKAGDWPDVPDPAPGDLALVCRPNLDVYSGLAGLYRTRHGNLRTDGVAVVLGRALAHGRQRNDELWFGPGPLPAPDELAARHGDAAPQASYEPPGWARYPRVWERAAEISRGPSPELPSVLVHRDFHPGNVLWRRGKVSGVVDWQAACTGPAAADVAHCRVNLLTLGTDAAERFTALWQHASGTAFHPWADVVTIIGFLDDLRDDWGPEGLLVEDMLARAVAQLGGSSR